MALTAYLTLQIGSTKVVGSSRFKSREGQIIVTGMSHEIRSPLGANGVPETGRRHRALVIQKDVDRSSPTLWQAFRDNLEFKFGFLEFTRFPPNGGEQEIHASINFGNARIVSIRGVMPSTIVKENSEYPEYEEVAFAYETLNWTWSGKDIDSSKSEFTESDCDFSADSPSWIEAVEARIEKSIVDGGLLAGGAAIKAFKSAFLGALSTMQEPPR